MVQIAIAAILVLPFDGDDLVATAEPLVVLDVRGEEIATLPAVDVDRTRWIDLGKVPTIAVSAVIESEDNRFWDHRGVDGLGLARALWLDLRGGRFGGSTLTMQLARMLISPGQPRTIANKGREMLFAL